MVVLKVALTAYYWVDLMATMKADYSVEMMEHSQVERKVDEMVALMVVLMAYYWVGLMVSLKVEYLVEMMVSCLADYSV